MNSQNQTAPASFEDPSSAEPPPRARQQRAEDTQDALLGAAIEQFSSLGYDGISVRSLESIAGVQRGAVAYHFENKETLWKRAVDRLFDRFIRHFEPLQQVLGDLDVDARTKAAIAAFVRFSAQSPELNRLMVQEGRHDSWRLDYIIESFIRQRLGWLEDIIGMLRDPHLYYILIGASAFVFDVEHECRKLFGVDPTAEDFVHEHALRVAELALAAQAQQRANPAPEKTS